MSPSQCVLLSRQPDRWQTRPEYAGDCHPYIPTRCHFYIWATTNRSQSVVPVILANYVFDRVCGRANTLAPIIFVSGTANCWRSSTLTDRPGKRRATRPCTHKSAGLTDVRLHRTCPVKAAASGGQQSVRFWTVGVRQFQRRRLGRFPRYARREPIMSLRQRCAT